MPFGFARTPNYLGSDVYSVTCAMERLWFDHVDHFSDVSRPFTPEALTSVYRGNDAISEAVAPPPPAAAATKLSKGAIVGICVAVAVALVVAAYLFWYFGVSIKVGGGSSRAAHHDDDEPLVVSTRPRGAAAAAAASADPRPEIVLSDPVTDDSFALEEDV